VRLAARLVLAGIGIAVAIYAAVGLWLYWNENRLVYFPDRETLPAAATLLGPGARTVRFAAPDGTGLVAWALPPAGNDSSAGWILVLHGNAGNLATPGRPEHDRQLHDLGLGVFALDYRGYGGSDGSPSEAGLYADAHAAYRYMRDTLQLPPGRIIIYGHSLGSAVAIQLATGVEAAGLIVEGGFTSAPDLGAELYPFFPVRLLARNRFNSLERIASVRMPVLFLHGRNDSTIPIAHGRRLFAAANQPKTFVELSGGHDDAFQVGAVEYESGIRSFLASLPR
jgi:hypothetical protein